MRIPSVLVLLSAVGATSMLFAEAASGGERSAVRAPLNARAGLFGHSLSMAGRRAIARTNARALKSWMTRAAAGRRLVYISDFLSGTVAVLDWKADLIGLIGGLTNPSGLFVDASHNLWVTNTYANDVLVYPKGSTSPSTTLADPNEFPVDVSVCPNGTAYVANLFDSGQKVGSISVYAPGATQPTGTLSYPGQGWDYFVTCDSAGNVFTTLFAANNVGAVVEYPGGKQSGALDLGIALQFPGGIKPDNAGNLIVNDQQARTVSEYTEAGVPTGVSIAYGTSSNDWVDIALTQSGRVVAGADAYLNVATALHFPSGKSLRTYSIPTGPSGDETDGIAFDPAQSGI